MMNFFAFLVLSVVTSTPTFQGLDAPDYMDDNYGRVDNQIKLSNQTFVNNERINRSYIRCTIQIVGCNFTASTSTGAGLQFGSGGAIFAQSSDVSIQSTVFQHNFAVMGGSLSFLDCQLMIESNTQFVNDNSDKIGGSLFFMNSDDGGSLPFQCNVMITQASFTNCSCNTFHGAASFSEVSDLYLESVSFNNCSATHSGGSLGIIDSSATLIKCSFIGNQIINKANISLMQKESDLVRGGGAIYVMTTVQPPQNASQSASLVEIVTENCTFCDNFFANATNHTIGYGLDILFVGECYWRSYFDAFQRTQTDALGYSTRTITTNWSIVRQWVHISYNVNPFGNCPSCESDTFSPSNYTETSIAAQSLTQLDSADAFPSPSAFIYQSTPLTRLPYRTSAPTATVGTGTPMSFSRTSLKIQSPTPSKSQTPSRSSYQETPVLSASPDMNTLWTKITASYFWEVPSTLTPSSTVGTWPKQSPSPTKVSGSQQPTISPSQSNLWAIPDQSPAATISFQYEPPSSQTPTCSPAASSSPSPSVSIRPDQTYVKRTTLTQISSYSVIIVTTEVQSMTLVTSESGGSEYYSVVTTNEQSEVVTLITIETVITYYSVDSYMQNYVQATTISSSGPSTGMIIGIVVGGFALVVMGCLLILFLVGKRKKDKKDRKSSGSEMAVESIVPMVDTSSVPMTQDNPLWGCSIMEDTDDPFRNDFEEDIINVYRF